MEKVENKEHCLPACLTTRRQFLFMSGAAVATATLLLSGIPGMGVKEAQAQYAKYPRMKIGSLSKLKTDKPVAFNYPSDDISNVLVKLGTRAGGGVGPANDIVAFNPVCTHMGGPLGHTYNAEHKILGQCPFHQSTFDLTRHGMIVSGHATESLPQILLEVEGNDIYATGVIGLVYGRNSNI